MFCDNTVWERNCVAESCEVMSAGRISCLLHGCRLWDACRLNIVVEHVGDLAAFVGGCWEQVCRLDVDAW